MPENEVCWETGDGWEKICEFLGEEISEHEFAHLNRGHAARSPNSSRRPRANLTLGRLLRRGQHDTKNHELPG